MIRGMWTSAAAMTPLSRAQEILANNLANARTGGFRQDRLAFHREVQGAGAEAEPGGAAKATEGGAPHVVSTSAAAGMAGPAAGSAAGAAGGAAAPPVEAESAGAAARRPAGPRLDVHPAQAPHLAGHVDLTAGPLETTEDRWSVAVNGPGFFVVQGPEGELYTRDGALQRAADGTLQHRSGYPILTEGGVLQLPPAADFAVASDGSILINGAPAGRFRVVSLTDPKSAQHAGEGLLRSDTAQADETSSVLQGSLEGANVDPVLTMVEMMEILRAYEANQRAVISQDATVGRLIQWASS